MSNVVDMNGEDARARYLSVDEALDDAKGRALQEVMIIGYQQDGRLYIRNSHMSCAEGNFLIDQAKLHGLNLDVEYE